MELTLFLSIILLALGIIVRSLGTTSFLLVGTALIGIAISFGNVLLPGLIKLKFPLQVGLMTAIFTVSMNLSGGIGAGLSYPIANGTSFGWQGALGFWAILAIVAIIVWIPQLKNREQISETQKVPLLENQKSILLSPLTWSITLCMGLQSLIFYTTAAWIPAILQSQGMDADKSGWMLSIMQFSQLPMTFIVPIIAGRLKDQRLLVVIYTILYLIGFTGLLVGPATTFNRLDDFYRFSWRRIIWFSYDVFLSPFTHFYASCRTFWNSSINRLFTRCSRSSFLRTTS